LMASEKLNYSLVLELARQLRVGITEEEAATIARDLSKILDYVKRLQELDLDSYEPTYAVTPASSVLRKDEVCQSLSEEDVRMNAVCEKGFIKAPKI
jgi:aspartyl-tRNA(Asn)/glutamyl-tRNA(Gln) amidotransferase subunit C